jgi:sugar phosphate permease
MQQWGMPKIGPWLDLFAVGYHLRAFALKEGPDMLHSLVLASSDPLAAGLILKGIKGIFYLIGGLIAAVICGIIAAMKGRNPFGWGILGFFFSIITLIVVIVIPSKK